MIQSRVFALTSLLLLMANSLGYGGIKLTLDKSVYEVDIPTNGQVQVLVDVLMAADIGTQDVFGYSIPIEISPPLGLGLPQGVTIQSVSQLPQSPFTTLPANPNFVPVSGDLNVGGGNLLAPATLTTTPVGIFRLVLGVSNQGVSGDYAISFLNDFSMSLVGGDTAQIANPELVGATLRLNSTAIPEPSSLAMIMLAAGSIFLRRS